MFLFVCSCDAYVVICMFCVCLCVYLIRILNSRIKGNCTIAMVGRMERILLHSNDGQEGSLIVAGRVSLQQASYSWKRQ